MSSQTIIIPTTATIIITRPAQLADIEALAAIEQESFPDDAWSASMFPCLVLGDTFTTQVATELSGDIVGFIVSTNPADGWVYVQDLAVAATARRKGVSRQLMTELLNQARTQDFSLHLHVKEGNEAAIALYRDLGFQLHGTVENFYHGGNTTALHLCWSA